MGANSKTEGKEICKLIKRVMSPGAKMPRSTHQEPYLFVRWGRSRGEEALVFLNSG